MEPKQHYGLGRKKVTQTKNCEGPQKCRQSQKGPILMSLLAVPLRGFLVISLDSLTIHTFSFRF